jgi:hypothetical protein
MEHNINLLDVRVQMDETISPDIVLNDKLSIRMKYPEFGIVKDSARH